jgi:predicted permease
MVRELRAWLARFGDLFHKQRRDGELAAELESHLHLHMEDNLRAGVTPEEARRQELLKLGGVEQTKEKYRDRRGLPWLESLLQDVRFGLRMLRKNPGFTSVAVLTLALGIGANTAIFSLVNAVLLNKLPVVNPHELVLFSDSARQGSSSGTQTGVWRDFSSEDYAYFSDHNRSFKELTAYQGNHTTLSVLVEGAKQREPGRIALISGNYFSFFGLHAVAGRLLSADDDRGAASPMAVLSYAYWTDRFHNDPSAMGKTIEFNGTPFTIVGVAPRGFSGVTDNALDFWLPLVRQPDVIPGQTYANEPHEYWLNIVARLKPGVTLRRAQADVNVQLKQILYAQTDRGGETDQEIADSHIQLAPGAGGISYLRFRYSQALQILAAIVGIVFLMSCANVATLLLSRSSEREREMSVRVAVGASRGRLIRQLLTESVLLAAMGCLIGILTARWAASFIVLLVTGSSAAVEPHLNVSVLVFTAGVSLLAGVVLGIVPAGGYSRLDLAASIQGTAHPRHGFGFANGIVVFQIAGSVVLLVGAGLFVRTFQKLADQNLGFDQDHILLVHTNPQIAGYKREEMPALYQALINRFEAIPGVHSATVDTSNPLSGSTSSGNFAIEGKPVLPGRDATVYRELVGPHYFETEGIPILLGRDIGPKDRAGMPLATVINQAMQRKYFPGVNPIGMRFSLGAPFNPKEAMTIVGVAADARYYSLRDAVPPMEFCAAFQAPDSSHFSSYAGDIEIRTDGHPDAIAAEIRPAIKEIAPGLPVTGVTLLKQQVSDTLRQNRSLAELSSGFSGLALLLACIGLYGTMAYRVSQRTKEIGVRMALGAQRSEILWLIAKESLFLIVTGLAIGVPIAAASGKILASQLFEVGSTDPVSYVGAAMLLLGVAALASYVPAQRAMRVDPMVALRHE